VAGLVEEAPALKTWSMRRLIRRPTTPVLWASGARHSDLKPSPGAIGGLNSNGTLYASSRGVFGLEELSLEPNTVPSGGSSVVLANARSVHLASGTRMLLSLESANKP
jgi:hypothetical protein